MPGTQILVHREQYSTGQCHATAATASCSLSQNLADLRDDHLKWHVIDFTGLIVIGVDASIGAVAARAHEQLIRAEQHEFRAPAVRAPVASYLVDAIEETVRRVRARYTYTVSVFVNDPPGGMRVLVGVNV